MAEVTLVYDFRVLTAKGMSPSSVADAAWRQAESVFGHDEFELVVELERGVAEASCRAELTVEVGGGG